MFACGTMELIMSKALQTIVTPEGSETMIQLSALIDRACDLPDLNDSDARIHYDIWLDLVEYLVKALYLLSHWISLWSWEIFSTACKVLWGVESICSLLFFIELCPYQMHMMNFLF